MWIFPMLMFMVMLAVLYLLFVRGGLGPPYYISTDLSGILMTQKLPWTSSSDGTRRVKSRKKNLSR
jgi:hypothetical protein